MANGKIIISVGYRFHPTDEEIVSHFLKNKMLGNDHLVQVIPVVDVCKYEPWELPKLSVVESDDPEWFFFCVRDFKYCHGRRSNRATREGYWKATGKDRKIKERRTKNLIGTKKTLVFYKGRVPNGVRTNWVMHEYHSAAINAQMTVYVVCRLKKKDDEKVDKSANDVCETSNVASNLQNRAIEPFHEPSNELPRDFGHDNRTRLIADDEFNVDEVLNSILVNQDEHYNEPNNELFRYFGHDSQAPLIAAEADDEINLDEFMNSILVNQDEQYNEELIDPFNSRIYEQGPILGSDTDNEEIITMAQGNWIVSDEYSSSGVRSQMKMMKKSRGSMIQSKHLEYNEHQNIYRHNEFSGSTNISGESSNRKSTLKRSWKNESSVSGGSAVTRIRLQKRIGPLILKPKKEASKYTDKDTQIGVARPPSAYFMNVIVGIILFAVFAREVVLYAEWI